MIANQDFYNTLTEHITVLPYYKQLKLVCNDKVFFHKHQNLNSSLEQPVLIKLFPLYLVPEFIENSDWNVKKVPQSKIIGYAIDLKKEKTIDEFLNKEYSKSFRANIRRFKNRFEDCFDVSYKMFFGSIGKEDYAFYMDGLHKMLTTRFNQRNESNAILENWAFYLEETFKLINQGNASIFVMYDNTIPVQISINHHFNNILFVSIPSFDIDYSKFALGNISIYKLLEWAIENDYDILDMAYGTLEYKRRWSNLIYDFEHHIIYNKTKLTHRISGFIAEKKLEVKNVLKHHNVDDFVKRLKALKNRKNNLAEDAKYTIVEDSKLKIDSLSEVDIYSPSNNVIKKIVFEFLYANKAHINQVITFKTALENEYVISFNGINHQVIVTQNP
ncbi:GNAT family N-acetyltransferase [Flavobacteriaceae bacterium SZ-1-7]|uniref:GNAT family N-acetyltransferase n=1 Tax=Tamlana sedimenti TaxID=3134126 RepID=UPI00312684B2